MEIEQITNVDVQVTSSRFFDSGFSSRSYLACSEILVKRFHDRRLRLNRRQHIALLQVVNHAGHSLVGAVLGRQDPAGAFGVVLGFVPLDDPVDLVQRLRNGTLLSGQRSG